MAAARWAAVSFLYRTGKVSPAGHTQANFSVRTRFHRFIWDNLSGPAPWRAWANSILGDERVAQRSINKRSSRR